MMRGCFKLNTAYRSVQSVALGLLLVRHNLAIFTEIGTDLTLNREAAGDRRSYLSIQYQMKGSSWAVWRMPSPRMLTASLPYTGRASRSDARAAFLTAHS